MASHLRPEDKLIDEMHVWTRCKAVLAEPAREKEFCGRENRLGISRSSGLRWPLPSLLFSAEFS